MVDFAKLKKNSGSLDSVRKAAEKLNEPTKYNVDEETYWKPELDKAGNAFAIVRFLPSPPQDGEDGLPWVKFYSHGFQGPGGWYIENSLTSLGKEDPVSTWNSKLWATGTEANKDLARKQKRRLHYVSNIYVKSDPKNPENEGKVFRFKYGKKIMEKILQVMQPEFEDEVAFDPFDFWTGADFRIKVKKVEGYLNYDNSKFDSPSPLFDDDDKKKEEVWNQCYSLSELLTSKHFKTHEELETKLNRVLGNNKSDNTPKAKKANDVSDDTNLNTDEVDESDEDLKYFSSLLEDDE